MKKIFVLGDSISIGYGPFLKQYIQGIFEYDRKSGEEEALKNLDLPVGANGGDSRRCLKYLQGWETSGKAPGDILVLNCGLHDLKWMRETETHQVPLEEYAENLKKIPEIVTNMKMRLVWVTTTPVDYELHHANKPFDRREEDVVRYNETATEIMQSAGADICDLYRFQVNVGQGLLSDGVHFDEPAQMRQASYIAGFLCARFL